MATEDYTGPVDYLVFAFDAGDAVDKGLQLLLDRVDRGLVVLLDIECVGRGADGGPRHVHLADLQPVGGFDLSVFEEYESRILDQDDLALVAAALVPDAVAVVIVYEERSLADVAQEWLNGGGELLMSGGIAIDELELALSALENGAN